MSVPISVKAESRDGLTFDLPYGIACLLVALPNVNFGIPRSLFSFGYQRQALSSSRTLTLSSRHGVHLVLASLARLLS